jgi:hypothetical protein
MIPRSCERRRSIENWNSGFEIRDSCRGFLISNLELVSFCRETHFWPKSRRDDQKVAGGSIRSSPEGKGVKRALKGRRKTIAKQGLSPLPRLSVIKYPTLKGDSKLPHSIANFATETNQVTQQCIRGGITVTSPHKKAPLHIRGAFEKIGLDPADPLGGIVHDIRSQSAPSPGPCALRP